MQLSFTGGASGLGRLRRSFLRTSWLFVALSIVLVAAPLSARAQSDADMAAGRWTGWVQYERPEGGDPIRYETIWALHADGTVQVGPGETGTWRRNGEYLELRYIGGSGARILFAGRLNGATYQGSAIAYNAGNGRYFEGAFELRK